MLALKPGVKSVFDLSDGVTKRIFCKGTGLSQYSVFRRPGDLSRRLLATRPEPNPPYGTQWLPVLFLRCSGKTLIQGSSRG